jgi:uncharacterized iron-regulated membrane protein
MSLWTRWVERPEKVWLRNLIFQIHFWIGAAAGAYIFLMSVTGSLLVFRNELSAWAWINTIVAFHANLLAGSRGRVLNGAGAISLTLLCVTGAVIWWPGIAHWRRSLTVEWRAHFARINWDLHSALGFWCFLFVLMWGLSGIYLALPRAFDALFVLDPRDRYTDAILFWLARLHFGRFGLAAEVVWALVGLVPAVLAFTGVFVCCRRVMFGKPSNPRVAAS